MPLRTYSFRMNQGMAPQDYKKGLQAIKQPLLVLVGSSDEAFVAEAYEPAIKQHSRGEVYIVKGASHNGIRQSEEAMQKIKDWANGYRLVSK